MFRYLQTAVALLAITVGHAVSAASQCGDFPDQDEQFDTREMEITRVRMSDQIRNPAGPLAKHQMAINLFNQGIGESMQRQLAAIQCLAAIHRNEQKVAVVSADGNIRLLSSQEMNVAYRSAGPSMPSDI